MKIHMSCPKTMRGIRVPGFDKRRGRSNVLNKFRMMDVDGRTCVRPHVNLSQQNRRHGPNRTHQSPHHQSCGHFRYNRDLLIVPEFHENEAKSLTERTDASVRNRAPVLQVSLTGCSMVLRPVPVTHTTATQVWLAAQSPPST